MKISTSVGGEKQSKSIGIECPNFEKIAISFEKYVSD